MIPRLSQVDPYLVKYYFGQLYRDLSEIKYESQYQLTICGWLGLVDHHFTGKQLLLLYTVLRFYGLLFARIKILIC